MHHMGRPPLGEHAMTDAERQRRRRAKAAEAFRDSEHVTKPKTNSKTFRDDDRVTKLTAETASLKARIRELEAELARERAKKTAHPEPPELPRTREDWEALKQRATEQRKAKRAAMKAAKVAAVAQEGLVTVEALQEALVNAKDQIARQRTEIANLKHKAGVERALRKREGLDVPKKARRVIWKALHPDKARDEEQRKLNNEALQHINAPFEVLDAPSEV
jgi:hypothetical protein